MGRIWFVLVVLSVLLAACGSSGNEPETVAELESPSTVQEVSTSTAPPTPAELALACLEGNETDEVTCQGARSVVTDSESISTLYGQLDTCTSDCGATEGLLVRALGGEDVTAEIGPGPDEVWGPDIQAIQDLYDRMNQANDLAGYLGQVTIALAATHPELKSGDLYSCLGEEVDRLRPFQTTDDFLTNFQEELRVDLADARRTDEWTLRANDGSGDQIDPEGRTYAYNITTTFYEAGFAPQEQTVEVHGHIDPDGTAWVFYGCTPDYRITNPNDTRRLVSEVMTRLDGAGIWLDQWQRPQIPAE